MGAGRRRHRRREVPTVVEDGADRHHIRTSMRAPARVEPDPSQRHGCQLRLLIERASHEPGHSGLARSGRGSAAGPGGRLRDHAARCIVIAGRRSSRLRRSGEARGGMRKRHRLAHPAQGRREQKDDCRNAGRTYTQEELENTGDFNAAAALKRLDPSIQ